MEPASVGRARLAAIHLSLTTVFAAVACTRLIDADEGYLLYAARAIQDGKAPYADFFFPQPPLFPYLFAAVVRPIGWLGARLFAATLAATTGTLLVVALRRRGLGPRHEWLGAGLFATTALAFAWLPIAKTYALATPLLLAAHVLATGPAGREGRSKTRLALVGVLLALAVASRLYLVFVVPVVALIAARAGTSSRRALGWVAAGFGAVALLISALLFRTRAVVGFDLVQYHTRLITLSPRASLEQKVHVVGQLLGAHREDRALGLQLALLALVLVAGALRDGQPLHRDPSLLLLASLVVLTVVPSPTYAQYFCVATPLLVELVVARVAALGWDRPRAPLFLGLAVHLSLAGVEARRHLSTGEDLIGVGADHAHQFRLATVRDVERHLRRYPGCNVVATWPGHLVETPLVAWPGTESHFGVFAAALLVDADARRRVHVLSREETAALIDAPNGPRLLVISELWPGTLDASIVGGRLPERESFGGVTVFGDCAG